MKQVLIIVLFLTSTVVMAGPMTQDKMEEIVISKVEVLNQKKGYIVFTYKKIKMALISDLKHNRMRIISPITDFTKMSEIRKTAVMESNFHLALDSRYAVSNDILYSAYIHPLSSLSENQIIDALDQVSTLALTFGTSYTSGSLTFGDL